MNGWLLGALAIIGLGPVVAGATVLLVNVIRGIGWDDDGLKDGVKGFGWLTLAVLTFLGIASIGG